MRWTNSSQSPRAGKNSSPFAVDVIRITSGVTRICCSWVLKRSGGGMSGGVATGDDMSTFFEINSGVKRSQLDRIMEESEIVVAGGDPSWMESCISRGLTLLEYVLSGRIMWPVERLPSYPTVSGPKLRWIPKTSYRVCYRYDFPLLRQLFLLE